MKQFIHTEVLLFCNTVSAISQILRRKKDSEELKKLAKRRRECARRRVSMFMTGNFVFIFRETP